MKAVILEIHGKRAAALTDHGEFVTLKNAGFSAGDSVEIDRIASIRPRRILPFAASIAAAFVILIGGMATLYLTPYSLVSLDVNPSIEYTLNRFDKVLSLSGVNRDGTELVARLDVDSLKFRSIDLAVTRTLDQLRNSSYLAADGGNYVVLAASAKNELHAEVIAESLSARLVGQADLTVESTAVSQAQTDAAHALGTTAGKLYVVEQLGQLMDEDDDFEEDEWLDRSVSDIIGEYERRGGKLPGQLTENETILDPTPEPEPPTPTPEAEEFDPQPPVESPSASPSMPSQASPTATPTPHIAKPSPTPEFISSGASPSPSETPDAALNPGSLAE